jgi:hypothetical protein
MSALRCLVSFAAFGATTALGFQGLVVSELPLGGDVTLPAEYPVSVPPKIDVEFSGVMNPQALVFANNAAGTSVLKIADQKQKQRTLKLKPGASVVYSFRNQTPVRVRVVSGDVRVSSLHPLKVAR